MSVLLKQWKGIDERAAGMKKKEAKGPLGGTAHNFYSISDIEYTQFFLIFMRNIAHPCGSELMALLSPLFRKALVGRRYHICLSSKHMQKDGDAEIRSFCFSFYFFPFEASFLYSKFDPRRTQPALPALAGICNPWGRKYHKILERILQLELLLEPLGSRGDGVLDRLGLRALSLPGRLFAAGTSTNNLRHTSRPALGGDALGSEMLESLGSVCR